MTYSFPLSNKNDKKIFYEFVNKLYEQPSEKNCLAIIFNQSEVV